MKRHAARVAHWTVRVLVGFGLLLVLAAGFLWWWAGQDGSLEWVLRRVARGVPLESQGVHGSLRRGWHIDRIAWEKDGLRLEAEDIRLEWQPIALLNRTLQLEEVKVARARVIDQRPRDEEPLKPPENLRLPWRVNVERLEVGSVAYQGRTKVDVGRFAAQYRFDGLRHRAKLEELQVAGGTYRGELDLLAVQPLTLDAKVSGELLAPVPGSDRKVPLQVEAKASGPAEAIEAQAQLRVAPGAARAGTQPSASATARIAPFAAMPLPQARAEFHDLDVALFWPDAPRTQLAGRAEVEPRPDERYRAMVDLRNEAAGPWDQQRLPVSALRGTGEWRAGSALLQSLSAQAGGGRIEGAGAWRGTAGWTFDGRVEGVDPAQLHTQMAPLPLTGPLRLEGEGRAVDFTLALQAGAARARKPAQGAAAAVAQLDLRDIRAQGRWSGEVLSLAELRVRTGDASLEGEGQFRPAGSAGEGKLQLRAPGLQARASGSMSETRGQGTAELSSGDLAQAQRWLARWPGVGPALRPLSLRGVGEVRLAWQGGWRDPTVQARAGLRSFAWQPAGGADVPPPWSVREGTLQLEGRLRDAALDLRAQAEQGQRKLDLAAAGRAGATLGDVVRWQGRLATLSAQMEDPAITPGPWRLQLRNALDVRGSGGNFDAAAGEAVLQAPPLRTGAPASEAVLAWGPVRRQGGQLASTGRLSGLPMAWIELLGGQQLGGALTGDLVFDAQWDVQWGRNVRLSASLARVRGDVTVLAETVEGSATRINAGVRTARVDVRTQGDQLELSMLWDSERAGRAEGVVRSRLAANAEGGWSWPERAPLAGRVQAQLPRIGVWSVLAPPGWRLRGALSADVRIAGTRAQPELSGPLNADGLALRSVVDGIELRNGVLRAQLAGQRLVVSEFRLHGSADGGADGGTLLAQGEAGLTPQGLVLQVQATLSHLRASIRSDRQLTVSGPVSARVERGLTTVTGELQVDRARIVIPDETAPRLAQDVVVRNAPGIAATDAERRQKPPPDPAATRKLELRVTFDMGPDFRVSGRGVDTRLAGKVDVRADDAGQPLLVGTINTVGGTYQAYGQRMNIERGELRFTGQPDNPALDVLAIRPNMVIKVGVQVTGRAQSPHIELWSDAGLSDAEILSYVVLGRASTGEGAETAMLQRAAGALLAGRRGTGKGLAGSLGLDDLSVSAPNDTTGAVVRVGKRFADNFYAAYERSLSGAMGTLYLFYDVSRRLTVRAEAGERTGVDLIFTFTFGDPKPGPDSSIGARTPGR